MSVSQHKSNNYLTISLEYYKILYPLGGYACFGTTHTTNHYQRTYITRKNSPYGRFRTIPWRTCLVRFPVTDSAGRVYVYAHTRSPPRLLSLCVHTKARSANFWWKSALLFLCQNLTQDQCFHVIYVLCHCLVYVKGWLIGTEQNPFIEFFAIHIKSVKKFRSAPRSRPPPLCSVRPPPPFLPPRQRWRMQFAAESDHWLFEFCVQNKRKSISVTDSCLYEKL